jgi:hypothetical protein
VFTYYYLINKNLCFLPEIGLPKFNPLPKELYLLSSHHELRTPIMDENGHWVLGIGISFLSPLSTLSPIFQARRSLLISVVRLVFREG